MKKKVLVKDFYDDLKDDLNLEFLAGKEGIYNAIENYRIQKPGLAIAGYLEHLHTDRVQVLGETEISYLISIGKDKAENRMKNFFSTGICCVVVTKGLEIPSCLLHYADEFSVPLFRSPLVSSRCIEIITDYLEDRLALEISVHGVLVDVFGVGVLIIGESGIGKSECALDLVYRGHRLVADDLVLVKKKRDILWGTSPALIQHFMEVRGLGIVNIKDLFGVSSIRNKKRIDLVVELLKWGSDEDFERLTLRDSYYEILGIKVPYVRIPVTPGRNITLLVEIAARLHLLRLAGYSPQEGLENLIFRDEEGGKGIE